MRTTAVAFLLSLACGVALTPLVRALAVRLGALDHALSSRKVHGRPVPRLGGLAIVAAFYAPLLGLLVADSGVGSLFYAEARHAFGLIVGGLAIALLGVYDDFFGADAKVKFTVQFAVAGLMYFLGFRIDAIATPFGEHVHLGVAGLPFTMLWIVGVVNAMNLIDGLDGLAGGVSLAAVATIFAIALQRGEPLMLLLTASLGGALLGFLRYNFNPASIFMGDTGSMFLGFVVATASIQTNQKSSTAVAMLIPIVALGLPIGDTLLAIARRAVRGAPLFHSDRDHIHHRLLALGLTQRQAVLLLYALCALLGATAVALTWATALQTAAYLAGVLVAALLLLTWAGYIRMGKGRQLLRERRQNLAVRSAIREAGDAIRRAHGPEEIWAAVKRAAPALGASCVALEVARSNGSAHLAIRQSQGFGVAGSGLLRARYGLAGERLDQGCLELGWSDGRQRIDRDTEIGAELLCGHVQAALVRLEAGRPGATGTGG